MRTKSLLMRGVQNRGLNPWLATAKLPKPISASKTLIAKRERKLAVILRLAARPVSGNIPVSGNMDLLLLLGFVILIAVVFLPRNFDSNQENRRYYVDTD